MTPDTRSVTERAEKLDLVKIKSFCSVKDAVKRMRRQITDWEKTFAKDTPGERTVTQHVKGTLHVIKPPN